MKRFLLPIMSFLSVLLLLVNVQLSRRLKYFQNLYQVEVVFDGDSFGLASGQEIRLLNLDAPELNYCGGPEAKNRLEQLVLGKTVRLEAIRNDQMRRVLALAYTNNILVNEILLREGLARYDGTPTPERERLKKAYDNAHDNKLGIFSLCLSEKPPNSECLIKGNVNLGSGIKTYHFPGCSNYSHTIVQKDLGEDWFCSEKEAQAAGFKKSETCYGKPYRP